ncbi:hypothetical protein LI90_1784 [Carbonactinospora thermoautotrophica]|uniref:Uncharacterized protein n=1 Tax=Carbonactinospora thermoautotrophica TaxID=1469144 RepID=A0A132MSE6_9ACTN|nr:hypothetical protein [Carbonactinospora thermoautotrophica]KWX00761.1 hypothetical protein LI90_1784 [Carbonactinospora thermoautotrophica]
MTTPKASSSDNPRLGPLLVLEGMPGAGKTTAARCPLPPDQRDRMRRAGRELAVARFDHTRAIRHFLARIAPWATRTAPAPATPLTGYC